MGVQNITVEQAMHLKEQCKHRIELREALHRLESNPDFQKILKDYTEDEPVRLVHLLAEPAFNMDDKKDRHREEINESMIGIARFTEYMRKVYRLADQATNMLNDLQKAEIETHSDME